MPATIELQREFEGEMNTLLIDFVNPPARVQRLALQKKWLGTSAMWAFERPFYPRSARPAVVLLSAEGEIVLEGSAIDKHDEVRNYLRQQRHGQSQQPRPRGTQADADLQALLAELPQDATAKTRLEELALRYPDTEAAAWARELGPLTQDLHQNTPQRR